jgi:hypothetical protein
MQNARTPFADNQDIGFFLVTNDRFRTADSTQLRPLQGGF